MRKSPFTDQDMPPVTFHVDAILFDMDGTLVDSTAGVRGAWELFRKTYPDIDVDNILSSSHGVRTVDNLKTYCGLHDVNKLEKEAERFEEAIVNTSNLNGGQGIVKLRGVAPIIDKLAHARHLPKPLWAICTSATRAYASSALRTADIPVPDVFVTAEDVTKGKPFPDPYLLAATRCGVDPGNCIVIEDAPSGLRSGKTAGCKTIGLLTTHSREEIEACEPDFLIPDLSSIFVERKGKGIEITINED